MDNIWNSIAGSVAGSVTGSLKSIRESYTVQYALNKTRYHTYWMYAKDAKAGINMNQITPNLWLGDMMSAHNEELLKKYGITHVVCAVYAHDPPFPNSFKYLNLPLIDSDDEDIGAYFDETAEWIQTAILDGGTVLVHCMAGVSRSATIVSAYLMKARSINVDESMLYIKSRRSKVNPNPGFVKQLILYESTLPCADYGEGVFIPKDEHNTVNLVIPIHDIYESHEIGD